MIRRLLIATLVWCTFAGPFFAGASLVRADDETISVEGNAEVRVVPDEVSISVATESRGETLGPTKADNDQKVKSAIGFLKQAGIEEANIKTEVVQIQPDFDYQVSRIKPVAYIVRRQLRVRLTKPENFETIFSGLIEHGINIVEDVEFRTTKLREHRDEARKMAIRAAKEKAEAMAKELEVTVAGVKSVQEHTWGGTWSYRGQGNNYAQNAIAVARGNSEGSEGLNGGQLQVTATVSVVFKLGNTDFSAKTASKK